MAVHDVHKLSNKNLQDADLSKLLIVASNGSYLKIITMMIMRRIEEDGDHVHPNNDHHGDASCCMIYV